MKSSPADVWPDANVYLRDADRYPRSATGVFYTPQAANDGSFSVRFQLSINDQDESGQIITAEIDANASVVASDPASAVYRNGSCTLELHATRSDDVLDSKIEVEQTRQCFQLPETDASGTYKVELIGD